MHHLAYFFCGWCLDSLESVGGEFVGDQILCCLSAVVPALRITEILVRHHKLLTRPPLETKCLCSCVLRAPGVSCEQINKRRAWTSLTDWALLDWTHIHLLFDNVSVVECRSNESVILQKKKLGIDCEKSVINYSAFGRNKDLWGGKKAWHIDSAFVTPLVIFA